MIDNKLLDFYFKFLQEQNSHVWTFPAEWVNNVLLSTKKKDFKSLKGFAFTKAMKFPWKNSVLDALRELQINYKSQVRIENWKVSYRKMFFCKT